MPAGARTGDRRAARDALRTRRRAEHAPGPLRVAQDWYVGVFIAATLLTVLFAATGPAILRPDCDTAVCLGQAGHDAVALVGAVVGALALLLALRMVGPVSADSGQMTWLVSTPADRGIILRGRVLRVAACVGVASGVWGALVGLAAAGGRGPGTEPTLLAPVGAALGLLLALILLPLALWRQGGSPAPAPAARSVPDVELSRAGRTVEAVTAATLMMDGVALEVLAAQRRLARRGAHPSRPGAGGPLGSVLVHELHALRRRGFVVAATLLVPCAALVVGLLLGRLAGVVLAALATFAVARVAAGGLTSWLASPGLRRALPAHPAAVTAVLAGPPTALAVVAAQISVAGLGLAWWVPFVIALSAAAGVVRAGGPPPGLGVALSTPGGALHVGLVQRLVHGTDLAVLGAAAALIGEATGAGPATLLLGAALLAWQLARSRD